MDSVINQYLNISIMHFFVIWLYLKFTVARIRVILPFYLMQSYPTDLVIPTIYKIR